MSFFQGQSTPLDQVPSAPTTILPSGRLRPGCWLFRSGLVLLSPELKDAAKARWPTAEVVKPYGSRTQAVLGPIVGQLPVES